MAWHGTLLGGSIGWIFGPAGAIAGAAAGHYFIDQKQARLQKKNSQILLTHYVAALHDLAICDGALQRSEEELLQQLAEEYNLVLAHPFPKTQIRVLTEKMFGVPEAGRKFAALLNRQLPLCEWIAARFFRLASVDGNSTPAEQSYLRALCFDMGLPEFAFSRLFTLFVRTPVNGNDISSEHEALSILGLPPGASADEVRQAHRSLSLKYHPDRHTGLPPEIMELTAEKFRSVQHAYQLLCGTDKGGTQRCTYFKCATKTPGGEAEILEAHAAEVARCLLCGKDAILPDEDNLGAARCPFCQARLTLMRHDLDLLFQEKRPYPQPTPQQRAT